MANTTLKLMLQTIRKHCVACCGGVTRGEDSPEGCTSTRCDLFPYRTGRNPNPNPNRGGGFKRKPRPEIDATNANPPTESEVGDA